MRIDKPVVPAPVRTPYPHKLPVRGDEGGPLIAQGDLADPEIKVTERDLRNVIRAECLLGRERHTGCRSRCAVKACGRLRIDQPIDRHLPEQHHARQADHDDEQRQDRPGPAVHGPRAFDKCRHCCPPGCRSPVWPAASADMPEQRSDRPAGCARRRSARVIGFR